MTRKKELYQQTFAPELREEDYGLSKKRLPIEIWESIKRELALVEDIAIERCACDHDGDLHLLLDTMLEQQAPFIGSYIIPVD